MMHQLWTRRHVVRVLSCTGATLLRPMLSWTQPQDTMAQPALAATGELHGHPTPSSDVSV